MQQLIKKDQEIDKLKSKCYLNDVPKEVIFSIRERIFIVV